MASINFYIRNHKKDSNHSIINVDVKLRNGTRLRASTKIAVDAETWASYCKGEKKEKSTVKSLRNKLNELYEFLELRINEEEFILDIEKNINWLKSLINEKITGINPKVIQQLEKKEKKKLEKQREYEKQILLNFIDIFNKKRSASNDVSKSTIQKFNLLKVKIEKYQDYTNQIIEITKIDEDFLIDFKTWLMNEDNLMESTANRTLKNLKTVILEARKKGIKLKDSLNGFSISSVKSETIYLSFEELEKIQKANIIGDDLLIARDWLIIGCYTGQRVSDLFSMEKRMINTITDNENNSFKVINLIQQKTIKKIKEAISIPIHYEVENILNKYNGEFPPLYTDNIQSNEALFNRYLKKVCQLAGINEIVKGKVYDKENKKHNIELKEKFNFVASHICRRSFATNFYGNKRFTTPQLMAITGHKTESVFMAYIGKNSIDHALETSKTFKEMETERKKIGNI